MATTSRIIARALFGGALFFVAAGSSAAASARHITIAAAADLHYAMDAVIAGYRRAHPQDTIDVTYGSSGKLLVQIEQGAPFDLFFSADSDYPRQLVAHGDAVGKPMPYVLGRIVLWSSSLDASQLSMANLAQARFDRIAIANPQHAPYGKLAVQALHAAAVWDAVEPKLVYGENIAQTAQFAVSGNVKVGIIAHSLALAPEMAKRGSYAQIPTSLYQPLVQSFVMTRRGADNSLARDFSHYILGPASRKVLSGYGFGLPQAMASH
ncbi:molybdate ABC transporter substrate-binding protein [Rhodanobacter sp. Col0626]|uniref:molybdate ABC transporter substrate-binding protein n=1 Tax=Rhodanobacter sp. Col0626 TaxID=3415679 RepID=UPI003CF37F58